VAASTVSRNDFAFSLFAVIKFSCALFDERSIEEMKIIARLTTAAIVNTWTTTVVIASARTER
jgi:hypothetical protein